MIICSSFDCEEKIQKNVSEEILKGTSTAVNKKTGGVKLD